MQYDLTLLPNAVQRLEVVGRFFKFIGDGKVRITTNRGNSIELVSGQGVWNEDFTSLSVQDRSGALNRGVLLAGNYDFRDDTMTGRVEITNNKLKTTGGYVALQKGWTQFLQQLGAASVEIVAPAANTVGLVVNKIFLTRSETTASQHFVCAVKGADMIVIAASQTQQDLQDITQYEIPPGYGLYVRWAGADQIATRVVLWTNLAP